MSYEDAMNTILPSQGDRSPHINGHYGENRGSHGPHGGSDFNYQGGQSGANLAHPTIHSPVSGEVISAGGRYGMVSIRDAEGNDHQILHTQTQSVAPGQRISAGDEIATMGGRGPSGEAQYAQHVHYQMKDSNGAALNLEEFWAQRQVQAATAISPQPAIDTGAHEQEHAQASPAAAQLTELSHPGNGLFKQAQAGMQAIDAKYGRTSNEQTDNAAGVVAVKAQGAGMTRIDAMELGGASGDKIIAAQGPLGTAQSKVIDVPTVHALNTPLAQSSQVFNAAEQTQQSTAERSQQPTQSALQQAEPALSR